MNGDGRKESRGENGADCVVGWGKREGGGGGGEGRGEHGAHHSLNRDERQFASVFYINKGSHRKRNTQNHSNSKKGFV